MQCNLGIPIFSKNALDLFLREIPVGLEFHPVEISADGNLFECYLCKVLTCASIIDDNSSTYLTLPSGGRLIDVPIYRSVLDVEIFLARDRDNPAYLVASEEFAKLCADMGLNIYFDEAKQS